MSAVRTIFTDLVDRRLWPVALALVAALVAVPVLLGGGSDPAPVTAPAPIAAATPTGATQKPIAVDTPATGRQDRPGPVRNPFKQHVVKVSPAATTTTTNPGSGAASDTASPPPSVGSVDVGGGSAPPVAPTTPAPSSGGPRKVAPAKDVWRVNLRFGEAGDQHIKRDLPRLTPLPSATDPFFVFLGVLSDGKTAVFLVSSDATANGDGKCKPNPTQCDTIEMRTGDTEFFDVAQGSSGVVQYELDLLKVAHGKARGAAARAARRVSAGGHAVVHELKAEGDKSLGRYIYSFKRGVLVRRHATSLKAAASSKNAGAAADAHVSSVSGSTWGG
jgi:hypothetical protein